MREQSAEAKAADLKVMADKQEARTLSRIDFEIRMTEDKTNQLTASGHSSANFQKPTARTPIEQMQRWVDTEEQLLINRHAAVDEVKKMIAKKQKAAAKLLAKGG